MKVKATGEYMRRRVRDALLNRIPNEGEEFEVTRERFDILNGKNPYKAIFVIPVFETAKASKDEAEKAVPKAKKKAK